jgi:hypothetical protein
MPVGDPHAAVNGVRVQQRLPRGRSNVGGIDDSYGLARDRFKVEAESAPIPDGAGPDGRLGPD